ncbi:hypothetical protein BGZ75_008241, partial [Mortierella antarctica]
TYTLTVTNGEHTSFTVPCSTCSACPTPAPCNTGSARPSLTTASTTTTTSATPTSTGIIDCQVNLQIGIFYNIFNGTVSSLSPSTGTTTLLFNSDGTGSVDANAVNILQTVYKSNVFGQVFKAQPGEKFTAAPNLNNPTNGEWSSFGARQDGIFMMAAAQGNGTAYYFPANSTAPPTAAVYTDLPGNSVGFCDNVDNCFTDLAFDGNGYLWVITTNGALFISTTPQTTTLGGKMKYIGQLQVDGVSIASPKVSVGIAFDSLGNVYYSGGTHLGGFLNYDSGYVSKASMLHPLVSTKIYSDTAYVIDLATCAYPTIDISSLLA